MGGLRTTAPSADLFKKRGRVIEMMWWFGPGMTGWGYGLMTVSMVLFWALVIFGVVALVRYLSRNDRASVVPAAPEELLAERFARGEIDEDEYRRRLEVLTTAVARR